MIISHILGGIGNQMFQYAAGLSLSKHLSEDYFLDLSDFNNYSLHNGYELGRVFEVSAGEALSDQLDSLLGIRALPLVKKIVRRKSLALLRGQNFVVEPHFNFWENFFRLKKDSYLYGYWQSEKYFKSIEKELRKEFSFKKPMSSINQIIGNQILDSNSVSLHVRRGDYLTNAKTTMIMNVCDVSYYQRAVSYISQRLSNPVVYIFSDDMAWVKRNIIISHPCVYVEHNKGSESYCDMQLMSLCKHHILANSSFSWWGAWLNSSADKIIVAPKIWFKNNNNDTDLIPSDWVRL